MQILIFITIVEAEKQEQINKASGEAEAMVAVANARAKGIRMVASALVNQVFYSQSVFSPKNAQKPKIHQLSYFGLFLNLLFTMLPITCIFSEWKKCSIFIHR